MLMSDLGIDDAQALGTIYSGEEVGNLNQFRFFLVEGTREHEENISNSDNFVSVFYFPFPVIFAGNVCVRPNRVAFESDANIEILGEDDA